MDNVREEEDCVDLSDDSESIEANGDANVNNNEEDKDDGDDCFKNLTDLTPKDIVGLEFVSELENFYMAYARCHGFVARKDEVARDVKGQINKRQLVCNREGIRNQKYIGRLDRVREHRPITHINCQTRFRVHFEPRKSKWSIAAFVDSHNHNLTPAEHIHLIPSYRSMSNVDKSQVDGFHLYGVRTSHIMRLMLGQKRGHVDLGFCKKDLYNHIDRPKHAQIQDVDVFVALCYLQVKVDNDPMSFAKFTTTQDGSSQHLF